MLMGESRSQTSKTCLFVAMFKWFGYRIYHKYWDFSVPLQTFFLKSFKNVFFFFKFDEVKFCKPRPEYSYAGCLILVDTTCSCLLIFRNLYGIICATSNFKCCSQAVWTLIKLFLSELSDLIFVLFDLILYVHSTVFQLCGTGLPGLNQY